MEVGLGSASSAIQAIKRTLARVAVVLLPARHPIVRSASYAANLHHARAVVLLNEAVSSELISGDPVNG